MQKNKTIELLKHLTVAEVELFDQFLNNSFFSKKKNAALLFKYLKKFAPDYNSSKLTERSCYKNVFKDEPFKNVADLKKKLKNPFYDLKQLFMRFIAVRELELNSLEKDFLVLNALKKRNIESVYLNAVFSLQKKVEQDESNNLFQQYLRFGLQDILCTNDAYKQGISAEQERLLFENLISKLDELYLENKFRYSLEAAVREKYTGYSINNNLASVLNKAFESDSHSISNSSILLYKKLIEYVTKRNSSLEEIQNLYIENFNDLSFISNQDIGITLINEWMTLHREGNVNALRKLFELYKKTIELNEQIWFESQHFDVTNFRNIIVISTACNEHSWTAKFIDEYGKLLPKKLRNNVIEISKAQVYKHNGEYQKVIDGLSKIKINDWLDQLTTKSLMLQCYYELKEWKALSYFLDAFSKYLRRNKTIPAEVIKGHMNYISFTKKLVNTQGKTKDKINALSEKLANTKNISGRIWLNQKLQEML